MIGVIQNRPRTDLAGRFAAPSRAVIASIWTASSAPWYRSIMTPRKPKPASQIAVISTSGKSREQIIAELIAAARRLGVLKRQPR